MFHPEDAKEIEKRLTSLPNDVKLILFSQTLNCESCPQTEALLKALCEFSERLKLEILNPLIDKDRALNYGIKEVPTIVIEGDQDYGIRYLGTPAGYEFASLMEDIQAIGNRKSGLSEESREKIAKVTEPLNLKVFVTPG